MQSTIKTPRLLAAVCAIAGVAVLPIAGAQGASGSTVAIDNCHVKQARGYAWFYCGVIADATTKASITVSYKTNLTTFKPNTGGTWSKGSGTLHFGGPGQSVLNLKFAVRNLTAAQVRKRLKVTLSNASGATITDATAVAG